VPIYQTASCQLDNTGQAARPFALRDWAISTLVSATTTSDVLEKRVAALEGGAAALIVACGLGTLCAEPGAGG
jgi:O-acetylhomoserine (thiol)-lyase